MNEVDLSVGYIVVDHVAQGIFEERAASGTLIVAENFHGDGRRLGPDGFDGRREGFVSGRLCVRFRADGLGLRATREGENQQ